MDLKERMSSVADLNSYILLSQDVDSKYRDAKLALNLSTIMSFKLIRSLEIEYFIKCNEFGAAFKLFGRLLSYPSSKTWGVLGSEVVELIQFWLNTVRQHLLYNHSQWWVFLKQILGFIKKLKLKDFNICSVLVEKLAEFMLELATNGKLDVHQQYEVLHTFNLFCADSSREVRLALKDRFEPYFIRLSTILASCGHLPLQLSCLEALLRWLQPRHDPATRHAAATRWFPPHLYPASATQLFLARSWVNFYQDARDFLNCANAAKELVTSVACRKLTVGDMVILDGTESRRTWLDVNVGSSTLSVVLEPLLLAAAGAAGLDSCEALVVHRDNVKLITLHSECDEVRVSVETVSPPSLVPLGALVGRAPRLALSLRARSDTPRVHRALTALCRHLYQVLLDVNNVTTTSSEQEEGIRENTSADEHSRFSNPCRPRDSRWKPQTGSITFKQRALGKSPSSVSTASIAQLQDKLAKLPYYQFTKELVKVSAEPELSVVSERTECNSLDGRITSEPKRYHGFKIFNVSTRFEQKKSQSDSEISQHISKTGAGGVQQNISDPRDNSKGSQSEKYVHKSANKVSNILVGSTDSVINSSLEQLKGNTDNLIDLLAQEALQSKPNEKDLSDSGVITEEGKKSQELNYPDSETIEDSQYTGAVNTINKPPLCLGSTKTKTQINKDVIKSTSDESNTSAISETPISFVNIRRRNQKMPIKNTKESNKNLTVDCNAIDEYFSQHIAENHLGDIIISPRLARKINESSTESSSDLLMANINNNFDIQNGKLPDMDIVKCINDIVDKVCCDFEKCTKFMNEQSDATVKSTMTKSLNTRKKQNLPLEEKGASTDDIKNPSQKAKPKKRQTKKNINDSNHKKSTENSKLETKQILSFGEQDDDSNLSMNVKPQKTQIKRNLEDTSTYDTINIKCSEKKRNNPVPEKNTSKEYTPPSKNLKPRKTQMKRNLRLDEQETSTESSEPKKQPIKLKFTSKNTKSKAASRGKLKLERRCVSEMSIIPESNNESDAYKTSSPDAKNVPQESNKKTPDPLARRKRKLYSPKDDQLQFEKSKVDDCNSKPDSCSCEDEDNIVLADVKRNKNVTPNASASCYREIENERIKFRIRTRKSKDIESHLSPKTKRLNDVFEKLKESIEVHPSENIILVDKHSDKDAMYNFTTDSEDEDFKKKKIEVQKRPTTGANGHGTPTFSTRRGRKPNKLYMDDNKESASEIAKPVKRKRAVKKESKMRSAKPPEAKVDRPTCLIDEKMREAAPETLNTSFITSNVDNNYKEIEPTIQAPVLEVMSEENANVGIESGKFKIEKIKKQIVKKVTKVGKTVPKKQQEKNTGSKNNAKLGKKAKHTERKEDEQKDDDRTISPLPCLVVETEVGRSKLDDSMPTNLMQNFQKVYKNGSDAQNDTITTTKMLSDNEKAISLHMNITDELEEIFDSKKSKLYKPEDKKNSDINTIDNTLNSEKGSKISINESNRQKKITLKKDKTDILVYNNSVKKDNVVKANIENIEKDKVVSDSNKSDKATRSRIDQTNYDENISIDSEFVYRTPSKSKVTEVIDLSADSEDEAMSERSIATNGITGHGDISELPPSPKLLSEKLTPREIEDMDATTRKFYIELSRQVINGKDSAESQLNVENEDDNGKNEFKSKDDAMSDSKSVKYVHNKPKRQIVEDRSYALERLLPSLRETSTSSSRESVKLPTVSITRLSSKEISKWLPSGKTSPVSSDKSALTTHSTHRRSASNVDKQISPESHLDTFERRPRMTKCNISQIFQRNIEGTPKTNPILTRYQRSQLSWKKIESPEHSPQCRKTQISPINIDECFPNSKFNDNSVSKDETNDTPVVELISKLSSIAERRFKLRIEESIAPIRSEISQESSPKVVPKRGSPTADSAHVKRRKIGEGCGTVIRNISESRQTSSVEDWLRHRSNTSVDSTDAFSDVVNNIMEKIDTTLLEIQQNTNKEIIKMYVEAQQQLESIEQQRRRENLEHEKQLELMKEQYRRENVEHEERIESFMGWLRERSKEVLLRDCRQKRVLVTLMREDVLAEQRHIAAQRK